jgi:hypothetical protein
LIISDGLSGVGEGLLINAIIFWLHDIASHFQTPVMRRYAMYKDVITVDPIILPSVNVTR